MSASLRTTGGSLPGSSVRGILQARTQRGLPCSPSGGLPHPGIELASPAPAGLFTTSTIGTPSRMSYPLASVIFRETVLMRAVPGGVVDITGSQTGLLTPGRNVSECLLHATYLSMASGFHSRK